MKSYGQFCPVAKAAELFCERWTPLILRDLTLGASRFSELQRGVPLMSATLLSRRLKQLESEGVIQRKRAASGKSWTYHLTAAGAEFAPLVVALGVWGRRWTRRALAAHEVNVAALAWTLERTLKPDAFGPERCTVLLKFRDQPAQKSKWWFVNEEGALEICLKDPGHDVDLYVTTTVKDMIYVVRGDLALSRALDENRMDLVGPRALRMQFRAWLNLGPLAKIKSQRADGGRIEPAVNAG